MVAEGNDYKDLRLPESDGDVRERIDKLVRTMLVRGELKGSPTAVLLGQYYHLGGVRATEMLARQVQFTAQDTVLDVCCSVGGATRFLAEFAGCRVVGLDTDAKLIALARRLTELSGLQDKVTFVVEDLYRANRLEQQFTGIWSEGSLDNSLDWLPVINETLLYGGKLAFSMFVRKESALPDPPNSLTDVVSHLSKLEFDVLHCEEMREWEIEHGWKALLRQLDEEQSFYEEMLGLEWVQDVRERFCNELEIWTEKGGNAFFVAKKAEG